MDAILPQFKCFLLIFPLGIQPETNFHTGDALVLQTQQLTHSPGVWLTFASITVDSAQKQLTKNEMAILYLVLNLEIIDTVL